MPSNIEVEAGRFIRSYAAFFSDPAACSSEHVADLAKKIGVCYRPGMTMFTNGKIARFDVGSTLRES